MTTRRTHDAHSQFQDLNAILSELGAVRGQLNAMQQTSALQHEHTKEKIGELKASVTQRMDGLEDRVERLEEGEKKLIWKLGGVTGAAAAVGSAMALAAKYLMK